MADVLIFISVIKGKGDSVIKTIYSPDLSPSEGECVVVNGMRFNVKRVMIDYDENKNYVYISPIMEASDD